MEGKKRLDGWQEIANHLSVSVRAAQIREERHGMPIYRAAGTEPGKRSMVFAYREELDAWMRGERPQAPVKAALRWTPTRVAVFMAVFVLLTLGGFWWVFLDDSGDPVTVRRGESNSLLVYDERGDLLWSRAFDTEIGDHGLAGMEEVVDLDDDGSSEVLFHINPGGDHSSYKDRLLLLGRDGRTRWEFRPGRGVTWEGRTHTATYAVRCGKIGRRSDGRRFVVVASNNNPSYPSQTAILDSNGDFLGEYWHTGFVFGCEVTDLDGDGTDEILLGGINSRHDAPFFAVVAHNIGRAISPVPDGYAPGFPRGREKAYFLLPRTDVAQVLPADSRIAAVGLREPDLIVLEVEIEREGEIQERVYCLDYDLNVVSLDFPTSFEREHKRLAREGLLDHEFDPKSERGPLMIFNRLR